MVKTRLENLGKSVAALSSANASGKEALLDQGNVLLVDARARLTTVLDAIGEQLPLLLSDLEFDFEECVVVSSLKIASLVNILVEEIEKETEFLPFTSDSEGDVSKDTFAMETDLDLSELDSDLLK